MATFFLVGSSTLAEICAFGLSLMMGVYWGVNGIECLSMWISPQMCTFPTNNTIDSWKAVCLMCGLIGLNQKTRKSFLTVLSLDFYGCHLEVYMCRKTNSPWFWVIVYVNQYARDKGHLSWYVNDVQDYASQVVNKPWIKTSPILKVLFCFLLLVILSWGKYNTIINLSWKFHNYCSFSSSKLLC